MEASAARGSSSTSAGRSTPRAPTWRWRSSRSRTSGWRWSSRVITAAPPPPGRAGSPASLSSRPAAPGGLLPRMDIAGPSGSPPTGPVDVPVAVSDPARFAEVFGTGARARLSDAATGAHGVRLPRPTRCAAFFRNGGQRCWVVRVAGWGRRRRARSTRPGLRARAGLDRARQRAGAGRSPGEIGGVLVGRPERIRRVAEHADRGLGGLGGLAPTCPARR